MFSSVSHQKTGAGVGLVVTMQIPTAVLGIKVSVNCYKHCLPSSYAVGAWGVSLGLILTTRFCDFLFLQERFFGLTSAPSLREKVVL